MNPAAPNNPPAAARLDPRRLPVADAARLLNSTPLGEVARPHALYRHLNRGGARVGDGRTLDLARYAAWLYAERRARLAAQDDAGPGGYAAAKEAALRRSRQQSETARDLATEGDPAAPPGGWVRPPADPERKARCRTSFRAFCEAYLPRTFRLAWSPDHLRVIGKIERAVLEGGLFAMAMPRGSGKTSLCETACLWALLYGHREFVALVGADEAHAAGMLDSIKAELEGNDLLDADFSEATGPVRALDGIHQRAAGQLYKGKRTNIGWTNRELVLPTIEGSLASGGVIRVAGITGRVRGMKHKRSDGHSVRPSLVLVDDPQTDESARSPGQCAAREAVLNGAVLGLAGPGRRIAGLTALTVVRPGDLADRLLDRDLHPQWRGERTRLVYAFPSDERRWAEYARLRAEGQRADAGTAAATAYYAANREAMDEGAVVAWPERHNPDELSAVQHAANLRLDHGEAAFWAEYQNDPRPDDGPNADGVLTAEQIAAKVSGLRRGECPAEVQHVVAFVDVQGALLYWLACGWADDFTGCVLDYGTYPDQRRAHFSLRDARRTLRDAHPGAGPEAAMYAGLEALVAELATRDWPRADGVALRAERILVDANWGASTDVVYQVCRRSDHAAVLMPAHGRYVGAASVPFAELRRRPGDRAGHHWRVPCERGGRGVRHLLVDANFWKTFAHARLAVPVGDPGCLSLFGRRGDGAAGLGEQVGKGGTPVPAADHRLLAEHLTAEVPVRTAGRGREVDEWRPRGPGRDNHWLDCLVGCCAAGSLQGAVLHGTGGAGGRQQRPPPLRLSEIQKNRRVWRPGQPPPFRTPG